jgi:hypothetical protein
VNYPTYPTGTGQQQYTSDIVLGERYRDRDTKIEGVADSVHFYRNACERVVLKWPHDGEIHEASFDSVELERVSTGEPARSDRPGGPARTMPSRR